MAQILGAQGPTIILFGGKGGVGKTTVACAAALEMARLEPDSPILLASTDPAHSLGDVLLRPIGPEPVRLTAKAQLWAQELSGAKLLETFIERNGAMLATLMARGVFIEQKELEPFFQLSLPGLDEVMAVLSLADALRSHRFRRIVLDTAPTGHTLRLLQLPEAMQKWTAYLDALQEKHRLLSDVFGAGNQAKPEDDFLEEFSSRLAELRAILADPARSCFVPVGNAEPMALAETVRLASGLRRLGLPMGPLVLNRAEVPSSCRMCSLRATLEQKVVAQYPKLAGLAPFVSIPRFDREVRGEPALEVMARYLVRSGPLPSQPAPLGATEPSDRMAAPSVRPSRRAPDPEEFLSAPAERSSGRTEEEARAQREGSRTGVPAGPDPAQAGSAPAIQSCWRSPAMVGAIAAPAVSACLRSRLPPIQASVRLVLFGGKGGVGKTSLASTYAIGFARCHPDKRILVLSTDPAHSLSDFFGEPVGDSPKPWSGNPGLELQALDPDRAFHRMKAIYRADVEKLLNSLAERAGIDLPAERLALLGLLDLAPPGLDEMMALAGLAKHLRSGRYELHILDTAPTGHTLRFLELPELALDWMRAFFALFLRYKRALPLRNISRSLVELSRDLHLMADLFRDSSACCFLGVTAPTAVALAETERLFAALSRIPIRCHGLVVNRVPEPADCPLCTARARGAAELISAALDRKFPCPIVTVPEFPESLRADSPGENLDALIRTLGGGEGG